MTTRKLGSVAAKVLGTHEVVGAVVASLEHGPEALHAVDVGLSPDEVQGAVFDSLMGLGDADVAPVLVGVDGGVDEGLEASCNVRKSICLWRQVAVNLESRPFKTR